MQWDQVFFSPVTHPHLKLCQISWPHRQSPPRYLKKKPKQALGVEKDKAPIKKMGKKILIQHHLSPLQGSLNTARKVLCDKGTLVLSSWWSLSVA